MAKATNLRSVLGRMLNFIEAVNRPDVQPDLLEMVQREAREIESCILKANPGEPIFTLRAQDRAAPAAVRDWARRALALGAPSAKVDEAMLCAVDMERWQQANGCKTPD